MTEIIDTRPAFAEFPKIPRLFRLIVITEKIDGTNGCVHVADDGTVTAGSRTRWITPESDNFGFAAWVRDHAEELRGLGVGLHYGEWWGQGIQRRYGLDHKRFSLFNIGKWNAENPPPACCHTVPVLGASESFDLGEVRIALATLREDGSFAAPRFMKPEGIVVYHKAGGLLFKATCEGDEESKEARARREAHEAKQEAGA